MFIKSKCSIFAENEIEIFERKFLAPLSSSRSSTTIVINDAQDSVKLRSDAGIRRQTMIPTPSSSSNTVSVSRVSPVSSSSSSSVPHHQHPHHVRVLRTSSKVNMSTASTCKVSIKSTEVWRWWHFVNIENLVLFNYTLIHFIQDNCQTLHLHSPYLIWQQYVAHFSSFIV